MLAVSFAAETKRELTQLELEKPCCTRAELSALVMCNGVLRHTPGGEHLDIATENAAIARRIFTLCKEVGLVRPKVLIRKKMKLKKNNIYLIRLPLQDFSWELLGLIPGQEANLADLQVEPRLVAQSCCKRSFLRGAFLARGSVNAPSASSYHLEIAVISRKQCEEMVKLANTFEVNAKCIHRKKEWVFYIKEGERITAFLSVIGAYRALLHFEDVRIVKDMRNSVNRLVNCETANLNKVIQASMKQLDNIRLIEQSIGLDNLPPKLREIAEARLQYPDLSLAELGEVLPGGKVSKSGVNHRLRKLDEMAAKLRQ